jgi:hypothetical protein
VLAEVRVQLQLPLRGQAYGHNNQRAAHQAAQLQLAVDQPSLDRLSKANLIRVLRPPYATMSARS